MFDVQHLIAAHLGRVEFYWVLMSCIATLVWSGLFGSAIQDLLWLREKGVNSTAEVDTKGDIAGMGIGFVVALLLMLIGLYRYQFPPGGTWYISAGVIGVVGLHMLQGVAAYITRKSIIGIEVERKNKGAHHP